MSFYQSAKELAAKGFYVFPLLENGKTPAVSDFTHAATNDPNDLKKFWYDPVLELEHHYNIGIATNTLLVVDVDNKGKKTGSDSILKLELEGKTFSKTLTQKTPHGFHHIYKIKKPIPQGANVLGPGLDIRARGGYIVGAGSIVDGKTYKINTVGIADAPEWIVKKCNEKRVTKKAAKKSGKKISQKGAMIRAKEYLLQQAPVAIEGAGGDQTTFTVAVRLKDFGLSASNCFEVMQDNWNENCQPPWAPDDLKQKIENAYAYGQNAPGADAPENDFEVIEGSGKSGEGGTSETGCEDEDDITDPIEELNKEFAFIVIGGKSTILKQTRNEVSYLTVSAFHDLIKASTIQTGNGRRKQLSELWMASHKRATYESIEMLPCRETAKGVYNLWRGFTCEPLKSQQDATPDQIRGVELFKEHALKNVCLDNADLFRWLMGYFAHLVQKPWQKPLTALVFKGKKGVGKNALIDRIGNLFGTHYLLTSNRRYITSNFNKHLGNLILFVLDEAFWSGDKQAEGILKDLITGGSHLIEQKGREMYRSRNLLRVCIIGNEEWVIPASEDERRFAVFNVGDARAQDKEFFHTMRVLIDKKGGNRLLLRELMDFDLKSVDVNAAPQTIGLLHQKIASLNPIHSWWLGCLKEGVILHFDFGDNEWPKTIGKEQLRNAFLSYAKARGIRSWLPDASTFSRVFTQPLPHIKSQRVGEQRSRQRVYLLPGLDASRAHFDHFIGHELEWEDGLPSNVIDAVDLFS